MREQRRDLKKSERSTSVVQILFATSMYLRRCTLFPSPFLLPTLARRISSPPHQQHAPPESVPSPSAALPHEIAKFQRDAAQWCNPPQPPPSVSLILTLLAPHRWSRESPPPCSLPCLPFLCTYNASSLSVCSHGASARSSLSRSDPCHVHLSALQPDSRSVIAVASSSYSSAAAAAPLARQDRPRHRLRRRHPQ